jgi:hypothetical protein
MCNKSLWIFNNVGCENWIKSKLIFLRKLMCTIDILGKIQRVEFYGIDFYNLKT